MAVHTAYFRGYPLLNSEKRPAKQLFDFEGRLLRMLMHRGRLAIRQETFT